MNFSIKKLDISKKVYDIQVKNNPTFTVGRSKLVVHNCFLSHLDDSSSGLIETLSEVNTLSMLGGGVGIGVHIRSADEKSVGVMPHLKIYDASCLAYRQNLTRRGSYAAYLRISHPDVLMFLEMRKPTGDQNMKCMNLHHGIMIPDKFMQIIENCMIDPTFDDSWELFDEHKPEKKETVSAKDLWQRILEMRMQTGEPYILFIDTANEKLPEFQKNLDLKINQSNICSEILLPTNKERTAVCCLSSINLRYYDEYKNNYQFFKDVAEMLDNVLTTFINNAPDTIKRAKYSAFRERAIGVGVLGFHTYLQQNRIPFESAVAKSWNKHIFKNMQMHLSKANEELGKERGNCPDFDDGNTSTEQYRRFSHTMSIAPTACQSLSNVMKTSQGNFTLRDILIHAGINIDEIHSTGTPQWVDFKTPIHLPTLLGEKISNKAWFNGSQDLYEITFDDNSSYKFTTNHRLYVVNPDDTYEWKSIEDITMKDVIMTKRGSINIISMIRCYQEYTWDISVPDAEHYFMGNGVVSHNSTSIIMGNISPSIEPIRANAYRQDTMSGAYLNKNHVLDNIIKEKCKDPKLDYDSIWLDIIINDGSIQHMDIFSDDEKEVFKTAMEIDQRWIIDLASDRQEYIDQTQSVNLFFRPDVNIKYLHAVHFRAWKEKLPTLYYCRSDSLKKSDKVSKQIERKIIEELNMQDIINGDDCLACHS